MKGPWILMIRLIMVLVLACCILCTLFLYLYPYEAFTTILFKSTGQGVKLEKFRALLLTSERFYILRIIACAVTLVGFATVLFLWKRAGQAEQVLISTTRYVKSRIRKVAAFWQTLPITSRYITLILLGLIFLVRLYFLFRFPFHVDERFTYLYFVDKGLLVSMAYYPGPNNHILFTIICNLFNMFISSPLLVMKLPALLIGLVLSVAFLYVLSRYFAYSVALVITALFSFAEPVFYYSLQGRGYALLMFFVLMATHSVFKIAAESTFYLPHYFWFWLSCTLGFYTIPVFLYPFVALVAFVSVQVLLQRRYTSFRYLVLTSAAVIGSVFLLYLPVIIFNGWHALAGNAWISPVPWKEYLQLLPPHLLEMASGVWGSSPLGLWLTLLSVICCLAMVAARHIGIAGRQWMMLYLIQLAVIISLSCLQRLILPLRVVFYLNIYQHVVLVMICLELARMLINRIYKPGSIGSRKGRLQIKAENILMMTALVFIALWATLNMYHFYTLSSPGHDTLYNSFDATARWLYDRQANNIFVNEYDYSLCIRFQYETHGKEVLLDTHHPVAGKEYMYLVIHHSQPYPEQLPLAQYRQVYEDTEAIIYKIVQK